METRPALATEEEKSENTPMQLATLRDKIDVLRVLLEHDRSLGYLVPSHGFPLLVSAAFRGHVGVSRELLKHCPDAPLVTTNGSTCLHTAVSCQQTEFVDFVLGLPQSGRLVNMRDSNGDTALHLVVGECNPKMVAALLLHPDIDITVINNDAADATWKLHDVTDRSKTLNWVRTLTSYIGFLNY
jgi:ankyrin repeat protein